MTQLRFADCTLDRGRRLLLRAGDPVRLPPKAFQLLELLIARRPDAVSKEDIQEALWPGVFVTDSSLAALVKELRRALGDSAKEPTHVRTVFGFGYAFDALVHEVAPAAPSAYRHLLRWKSHSFDLPDGTSLIGRERTVDVWLGDSSVSREHARVVVAGARAEIEDLGSKNGTSRNGRPLKGRETMRDGDEIHVGSVVLVYQTGTPEEPTQTEP